MSILKEIRTCHPQIWLFDIKIICIVRQLRIMKCKTRLPPFCPKAENRIFLLLERDCHHPSEDTSGICK